MSHTGEGSSRMPGAVGESSGTRTGPGVGGAPPGIDMAPGWGIIEDGGGAPSMVEISNAPEGSMRARAPTLRFYDIDMQEHRLWQAIPHPDRPTAEGDTCSFPDFLVYAVEHERDYLLGERSGLTAQVELLQRDVERYRTEASLARTDADIARLEAHASQSEVTGMRYRVGGLRDELEQAEEHIREARLETVELRSRIRTMEETIYDLRQQVRIQDSCIERGKRYMRRSYEELEAREYRPEIPIVPPSESSVSKRARYYEPLEGSSDGSTDSDHDDEPGGATSGDSAGTPAAEPG